MSGLKKASLILILFAIISKSLGILREVLIAYYFGTSRELDAYIIGMNIPLLVMNLIAGEALVASFIPIFSSFLAKGEERKASEFGSTIINLTSLIFLAITCISFIFAPFLVKITAPGFSPDIYQLAIKLTRIMLFSMIFFSLSSIFRSILNSYQSFTLPGLQQTALNLSIILIIIIGVPFLGVYALAWGFLLGSIIQLLIQIPSAAKKIRYGFFLSKTDGFFSSFLPLLLLAPIGQLNIMVTKIIASMLGEGNISALGYSEKMMEIANNLLAVPISTVIFPYLATSFHKQDLEGFAKHLKKGMNILFFATLPITLFFLFFSHPIIEVLFKRGLFLERSVKLTSCALFYYAFTGLFGSLNYLLVHAFYSLRRIGVIVGLMCISFVANILLAIVLSKLIGIGGITLAMSISSCLLFFLLFFFLSKEIDFQIKDWLSKISLICIIQIMVFFFGFLFYSYLPFVEILRLILASLSILASISFLSWAFKIEEFIWLTNLIRKR